MNDIDAKLLEELQRAVPMIVRPYEQIGDRLGISEADVIARVSKLRKDGIIRQISAIFDSASLGYISALVAFEVSDSCLDTVAEAVAAVSGVSHCYSRQGQLNLWFTMTVEPGHNVTDAVAPLARLDGVESHLLLPAIKVFKVGVFLKLTDGEFENKKASNASDRQVLDLSPKDIDVVRALQRDLVATECPFDSLAKDAGMPVEELLARGKAMMELGAMRRFAAVLRHRSAGYTSNAMVCWRIDEDDMAKVGLIFAGHASVSHCYERSIYPKWPYAMYTMVHARGEDELARIVSELSKASGISDYLMLPTVKEYKKARVSYF